MTLDKRALAVTLCPGDTIKHEEVKVLEGEGMPVYGDPFTKGNLIINFVVHFPTEDWFLDLPVLREMERILPPKEQQIGKFIFQCFYIESSIYIVQNHAMILRN